jgi:hypothetical protein
MPQPPLEICGVAGLIDSEALESRREPWLAMSSRGLFLAKRFAVQWLGVHTG